jgi:ABC-2 type transport system ATP-binding protein
LFPTSGSAEALGLDPFRERRRLAMNIGVVFGQKPQLLWDIPAGESFKLLKGMYRIPEMTYRYTYGEAVERLELAELLKTPVRLLSLGQRMRCDLAAALLHAPALAFLDEPTIGLDVLAKERAREFIREMRRRFGTTVLLTTHDLKDIEASADRLIVLDRGQVIHDGDISGFRQAFGDGRIVVADLESDLSPGMLAELTRECERLGVRVTVESSRRLRIDCSSGGTAVDVTRALLERFRVRDLTLQTSDIETVVAKLYRGDGARQ